VLTLAFAPDDSDPPAPTGRLVNSWRNDQEEPFARAFVDQDRRVIVWPGLGIFSFSFDSRDVSVWPDVAATTDVVRDMFVRVIQPIILQAMGWQTLHASAVAGTTGAIVFCGVGHSGKSTLAYAAGRQAGTTQVADDAVVMQVGRGSVALLSMPFRPKLRRPSYDHLLEVTGRDPHAATAGATDAGVSASPLKAIFVLRQLSAAPRPARAERLGAAEAFRELLRHAHCFDEQDRAHSRALLEAYLTVVGVVPVYRLDYRPVLADLDELSSTVIALGLGASQPAPTPGARVVPC